MTDETPRTQVDAATTSPGLEERLAQAEERLAFYTSFDRLIQDNIARSGELMRDALALREQASVEMRRAESEIARVKTETEQALAEAAHATATAEQAAAAAMQAATAAEQAAAAAAERAVAAEQRAVQAEQDAAAARRAIAEANDRAGADRRRYAEALLALQGELAAMQESTTAISRRVGAILGEMNVAEFVPVAWATAPAGAAVAADEPVIAAEPPDSAAMASAADPLPPVAAAEVDAQAEQEVAPEMVVEAEPAPAIATAPEEVPAGEPVAAETPIEPAVEPIAAAHVGTSELRLEDEPAPATPSVEETPAATDQVATEGAAPDAVATTAAAWPAVNGHAGGDHATDYAIGTPVYRDSGAPLGVPPAERPVELEPRPVMVLVHGVPRAAAALSLQRHLASLAHVDGVEAREYAEGILRLQVMARHPLNLDDLRSWDGGAGLEPVHVREDVLEVRLPGAHGF